MKKLGFWKSLFHKHDWDEVGQLDSLVTVTTGTSRCPIKQDGVVKVFRCKVCDKEMAWAMTATGKHSVKLEWAKSMLEKK